MSLFERAFFFPFILRKIIDPARIRTWNPLIRSQMPYPLGHGAAQSTAILLILKITIALIVMVSKKSYFLINSLARLLSRLLSGTLFFRQFVIGQFNKLIVFKVVL